MFMKFTAFTLSFVLSFLFCLIFFTLILAFPFMWIWNYALVSAVTFANPIDYWTSFCLLLFSLFFKSHFKSHKVNAKST